MIESRIYRLTIEKIPLSDLFEGNKNRGVN